MCLLLPQKATQSAKVGNSFCSSREEQRSPASLSRDFSLHGRPIIGLLNSFLCEAQLVQHFERIPHIFLHQKGFFRFFLVANKNNVNRFFFFFFKFRPTVCVLGAFALGECPVQMLSREFLLERCSSCHWWERSQRRCFFFLKLFFSFFEFGRFFFLECFTYFFFFFLKLGGGGL